MPYFDIHYNPNNDLPCSQYVRSVVFEALARCQIYVYTSDGKFQPYYVEYEDNGRVNLYINTKREKFDAQSEPR